MARRRDPDRGRGRGRRGPDLRRGRRGGRDHAAQLPPDPGRPRLEDPVGRPSASGWRRSSVGGRSRSGVGAASVADIDRLNIYHATHLAMRRAIARLGGHDHVLVDGLRIADFEAQVGPYTAIVDGDARVYSIACASVIAKTVRDRMMHNLAVRYPEYGWDRNAGYATREHRDAIRAHGLTPHHRKSWQALQVLLAGDQLGLFDADDATRRRPRPATMTRRARARRRPADGRRPDGRARDRRGRRAGRRGRGATLARTFPGLSDKSRVSRTRQDPAHGDAADRPGAGRRRGGAGRRARWSRAAGRSSPGTCASAGTSWTSSAVDPGPPRTLVVVEVRLARPSGLRAGRGDARPPQAPALRRAVAGAARTRDLPDGTPLPRLPLRIDLVAIDRGPDGRPSVRHHRGLRP